MNNLSSIRYLGIFALLGVVSVSCSPNYSALKGETDDLYFMASDAEVATEFAVENNNPDNFRQLEEINAEEYDQENFSAKNVNPEYIAKYQSKNDAVEEGTVYFDDAEGDTVQGQDGDINIYNNFRGYNAPANNSAWNMNPMMMRSMYMGGLSPFGMGGLYDPFWGSGFGFRPGLSLSLGMGMGFGMGSRMWNPMMRYGYGMGGYGMGGFYDPFYSPYMGMGYGYGYGMNYYNRPIIILPGGSENQRQIVRGNRPSRSSYLATGNRSRADVASPGSSRATARREAVSRNSLTSRANSRNDFSRSQNDFYNGTTRGSSAASAVPSSRNINSPAMSRAGSTSNRSTYATPERRTTRTQAPANINTRRSSGDTRSRYAAPTRRSSPSYNRSSSPQYRRSTTPSNNRSNYSTPSRTRSSSPSYSAPSRSSGSSGGGATRSSGGSSRRGN